MLKLLGTCHRPACQTLSNAFLKSSCGTDRDGAVGVSFNFLNIFYDDSTIEHLYYCAPAWSETCLFCCQRFLSLGHESVENNSEHNLAGVAD